MKELFARLAANPGGYDGDKEQAKRCLEPGNVYPVTRVDMGGSYTDIYLEGFKYPFNSVCLDVLIEKIDGQYDEYDIFSDPCYNPYLSIGLF